MLAETRTSVRNAGWLFLQHGGQAISGVLFTLLIPRTMGSLSWGQYALLSSLSLWFIIGSRLGMSQVLGRYVPEVGRGEPLVALMGRLLTAQLVVSATAAGAFWLVTRLWLTDINAWALPLMGAVVFTRGLSSLLASLQHGLNRSAQWGLSQTVRSWLSLAGLLIGYRLAGLPGAAGGLLVGELLVLMMNIRWSLPYVGWPRPRFDLKALQPYVSLALVFAAAELVATSARHSGESILRLLDLPYESIGHFGLAYNIAGMGTLALSQVVFSFLPLTVQLSQASESGRVQAVLQSLLKLLTALGVLVLYATLWLGPVLIPALLGDSFRPVAMLLVPMALSVVATPLGSVGRLLCIVSDRPRIALIADIVLLATFWGLGVPLTLWRNALGLSLAVLISSLAAIGYIYLAMGAQGPRSAWPWALPSWAGVVALGLCGLPLCLLPIDGLWRWLLWLLVSAAYATALFATRLFTITQLRALIALLRPHRAGPALAQEER